MDEYINSDYIKQPGTPSVEQKKSQTKELLKKPIDEKSLKTYGVAKPTRIIMKARIINDSCES
ncbi:hypothetical protein A3733_17205 [Pseudoalteromonas shioyasakiensis]|nr:hypothetical protein A3733_17205 [Pseudoalteromonas shioyasakiensis]